MLKSQETWFGPVSDEELAELKRWDGNGFARARIVRLALDEAWIVLCGTEAERSSLSLRRREFDYVGDLVGVQRYEASLRLEALRWIGLDKDFRDDFDNGRLAGSRSVWASGSTPCGRLRRIEPETRIAAPFGVEDPMKSIVRRIEEEHGVIVYHVIWEVRKGVELYELLCVSPRPENWARERDSVACGWADAFVVSPAEPEEEVRSKIGVEVAEGGLLRRWPEERGPVAKKAAAAIEQVGQRAAAVMEGLRQQP